MAEGRLPQSVEMFMRPEEDRFLIEVHACLFANLSDGCLDQPLALVNAARWNLCSSLGMISMIEHE
jgi:hypothetical protein